MKLDRELQLNLLNLLADKYPKQLPLRPNNGADPLVVANLTYLAEHGLVELVKNRAISSGGLKFESAAITAKGMDFLAGDGGLSAIFGVVIVKLHDETIRHLLEARIESSNLPPDDKKRWLDQLRELRGESIKHLTMKLLDAGLENWPAALAAIRTSLPAG